MSLMPLNSALRRLIEVAALLVVVTSAPGQGLRDLIPRNQKPILKVLPPSSAEQSRPGVGKFVIFTREQLGKDWDFIAGAWECIPTNPEIPITKRVEFCRSSWNCDPLLDVLVADDSKWMHPRFARLQVNSDRDRYSVNLYDIDYRTWEVRCIWQGHRLGAFGVMGDSIFCDTSDGWLRINAGSGKVSKEVPFIPVSTDGNYWLVRKIGEAEGCWSYDRIKRRYIAHFGPAEEPHVGFTEAKLSADGRNRAWVLAPAPPDWRGGAIAGKFILQRHGKKEDVTVPIEFWAYAGSGVPVIPVGVQLSFCPDGKVQCRARKGEQGSEDRVWSIDITTGKVSQSVTNHLEPERETYAFLSGVPVPDYLRQRVTNFWHYGSSGLAPAFLMHLGILKDEPEYPACHAGVSRDGRHVLYRARKGPLSDVYIYGELHTKQTVRWSAPKSLVAGDSQEFVWVETPH